MAPGLANLQKLEQNALFDIFLGVILVLFWAATWGLIEELVTKIQEKKEIARWKIYLGLLMFVMFVVGMCPEMLAKF
jgi:hypothetical protein